MRGVSSLRAAACREVNPMSERKVRRLRAAASAPVDASIPVCARQGPRQWTRQGPRQESAPVDAPGSAPEDAPLGAPVDALLLPRRWAVQFRPRLSRLSEPLWATAATAVRPGGGIDIPQKTLIILNYRCIICLRKQSLSQSFCNNKQV